MKYQLPRVVEKEVYIFAVKNSWEVEYSIVFFEFDISKNNSDYILLGRDNVKLNIPAVDITSVELSALRKKKEQVLAKTELEIKSIDEKIQSLLCLEHK